MEISKSLMLSMYSDCLVFDVVNSGDKLFGKVVAGLHDVYGKVVWCAL